MNQRCSLIFIAVAAFAGRLGAQAITVQGTGDPDVDIPAIQSAVDQGGRIVLSGSFSFDRAPTKPDGAIYARMITISKEVVISGSRDQNGDMPTLTGGNWPFFVNAPEAHVTIKGLHFVAAKAGAIWVYAVHGLTIANCRIEKIQPTAEFAAQAGVAGSLSNGISVLSDPRPPGNAAPGIPENFSGTLEIANNDIDMGATPGPLSIGISIFSVGVSPDHEVDVHIAGNTVRNVSEPALNLRVIGGRMHVERNTVVTGSAVGSTTNPDAIRIVGTGSYLIAQNAVDCGWTDGSATGISVTGQPAPRTSSNVVILDNDVTMSPPDGTAFAASSAAIQIRGFAQGSTVLKNRLRGHARAGLAVTDQNGGIPGNNTLISNDLHDFQSSLADIVVDVGVTNTIVVGRQNGIQDQGSGTVVIPMP